MAGDKQRQAMLCCVAALPKGRAPCLVQQDHVGICNLMLSLVGGALRPGVPQLWQQVHSINNGDDAIEAHAAVQLCICP